MKLYLQHIQVSNAKSLKMVKKIIFDLIEYLSQHSFDPCGLFVGCVASSPAVTPLLQSFSSKTKSSKSERKRGRRKTKNWVNLEMNDQCEMLKLNNNKEINEDKENRDGNEELLSLNGQWDLGRLLSRWKSMKEFPNEIVEEMENTLWKMMDSHVARGQLICVDINGLPDKMRFYFIT